MNRTLSRLAVLAALVSLTAGAWAQSPKIGLVNLAKILEEWTAVKNFEAQINTRIEETQKRMEALGAEVEAISKKIQEDSEIWEPNSPELKALKDERRKKLAELKSTREYNLMDLQRQVNSRTLEYYNQAVNKIREYAEKNGYDLVLKTSDDLVPNEDAGSVKLKISYRAVLFYRPTNDITAAVLAELNK